MESKGKGYKKDKSMSVNASLAYLNGEMPKSKWTKAAIIEFLENEDLPDLAQKAQRLPLYALITFLSCTSWHHTSKFFNQTRFWVFDTARFEAADQSEIDKIITDHKAKNPAKSKEERAQASQAAAQRRQQKADAAALKLARRRIDHLAHIAGMPPKANLLKSIKSGSITLADVEDLAREALKNEITPYQQQNAKMRAEMGYPPIAYDDDATYKTLKKIFNL
jgi:hypothetical protein